MENDVARREKTKKSVLWNPELHLREFQADLEDLLRDLSELQTQPVRMRAMLEGLMPKFSYSWHQSWVSTAASFAFEICERLRVVHSVASAWKAADGTLSSRPTTDHGSALVENSSKFNTLGEQLQHALRLQSRFWIRRLTNAELQHMQAFPNDIRHQMESSVQADKILKCIREVRKALEAFLKSRDMKLPRKVHHLARRFGVKAASQQKHLELLEQLQDIIATGVLCSKSERLSSSADILTGRPCLNTTSKFFLDLRSGTHRRLAILMQRFHEGPNCPAQIVNKNDLIDSRNSKALLQTLWHAAREELRLAARADEKLFGSSVADLISQNVDVTSAAQEHLSLSDMRSPIRGEDDVTAQHQWRSWEQTLAEIHASHSEAMPLRRKVTKAKARLNSLASSCTEESEELPMTPRRDSVHAPPIPELEPRAVRQDSLDIFQTMFSNEGRTFGDVRWTSLIQALRDAGLSGPRGGRSKGSSVSSSNGSVGCTLHKPHDAIVESHMLRNMGKQLSRSYGWTRETFVLRRKDSAV